MWPDFPISKNMFTWLFDDILKKLDDKLLKKLGNNYFLFEGVYGPSFSNLRSRINFEIDKRRSRAIFDNSFFKIKVITEAKKSSDWRGFDLTLGFEETNLATNQFYFPLWYLLPGIIDSKVPTSMTNRFGEYPGIDYFLATRKPITNKDFMSRQIIIGFIRNITEVRSAEMRALSNNFKFINMSSADRPDDLNQKSQYKDYAKFVYCPENTNFRGYVTEKLFESYACGGIPVWQGVCDDSYLNKKAFINLNEFDNFEDFVKYLSILNNDLDVFNSYYSQPLLLNKPDIQDLRNFVETKIIEKLGHL